MSKIKKITLITAISLVVGGLLIGLISAAAVKFDREKLNFEVARANSYEISDEFNKIKIDAISSDIVINKTEEAKASLEIKESNKLYYNVEVIDSELRIIKSVENFSLNVWGHDPSLERKMIINLPLKDYLSLNVESTSGKIAISNLKVDQINIKGISNSYDLANLTANNLTINNVSGKINANNISLANKLNIKTVSGDSTFYNLLANEIYAEGVSASFNFSLAKNMNITTETISGAIKLPNSEENLTRNAYFKTVSGSINVNII